jgi:hypothetical protein
LRHEVHVVIYLCHIHGEIFARLHDDAPLRTAVEGLCMRGVYECVYNEPTCERPSRTTSSGSSNVTWGEQRIWFSRGVGSAEELVQQRSWFSTVRGVGTKVNSQK